MFSLDIHPGVKLPGHMVVLVLVFWGNSILFSTVAAPIYIPTNSVGRFPFLHIFSLTFVNYNLFDDSHSDKYEAVFHTGFDLHFSDDEQCWAYFHVPVDHLYMFFRKMSIQIFYLFLNWVVYWYWIVSAAYVFWILTPYWSCYLQVFSPFRRLYFHVVSSFLCSEKVFKVN